MQAMRIEINVYTSQFIYVVRWTFLSRKPGLETLHILKHGSPTFPPSIIVRFNYYQAMDPRQHELAVFIHVMGMRSQRYLLCHLHPSRYTAWWPMSTLPTVMFVAYFRGHENSKKKNPHEYSLNDITCTTYPSNRSKPFELEKAT